jgi:ABC-2 type transport system permease protein
MLAIFNKEFKTYFTSAAGYVFTGVFLLISGLLFALSDLMQSSANYSSVLGSITLIFLLLVPLLTMKILSEETHQKTDQLLLTSPLSLNDIVIGKYLAASALFLLTVAVTFIYPIILVMFGSVAFGEIFAGYVGFIFLGLCFISLGLFISAMTENQITAAVATFGVFIFIWVINWIQQVAPSTEFAGILFAFGLLIVFILIIHNSMKNVYFSGIIGLIGLITIGILYITKKTVFDGFIAKFFGWFSLLNRYSDFTAGLISVSSIVYFISFIFIFLFLTVRIMEKRRWS